MHVKKDSQLQGHYMVSPDYLPVVSFEEMMMNKRVLFSIAAIVILGMLCLTWATSPTNDTALTVKTGPDFAKDQYYVVVRIIDGDTIVVLADNDEIPVRLQGVDTPETKHPSKPVEHYGPEATMFTQNLLKGEKVFLKPEGEKFHTGKYGRVIAYAYRAPDGLDVNAELIRQGYAKAYDKYLCRRIEEFRKLEEFAKNAKKGLWDITGSPALPKPAHMPKAPPVKNFTSEKPENENQAVMVYVTRTGKKYHRGSCSYLRKSRIPMSLEKAKKQYSPCSRCNPPR